MRRMAQITPDGRIFLDNGEELTGFESVSPRQDYATEHLLIDVRLRFSMFDIEEARRMYGSGVLPYNYEASRMSERAREAARLEQELAEHVQRQTQRGYVIYDMTEPQTTTEAANSDGDNTLTPQVMDDVLERYRNIGRVDYNRWTQSDPTLVEQQPDHSGFERLMDSLREMRYETGVMRGVDIVTSPPEAIDVTPEQVERVERDGVEIPQVYIDGVLVTS